MSDGGPEIQVTAKRLARRVRYTLIGTLVVIAGAAAAAITLSSKSSAPPLRPTASTTATVPSGASAIRGYLASLSNSAIFIQWTQEGNAITGSAQAVYLNNDGTATSPEHETVTGSIQGSSITLNVEPDGLYGVSNLSGTIQGSGFIVTIPNDQGSLIPVNFNTGTVADYDEDVSVLQGSANQGSNAQSAAQAQQAAAAAVQQDEQTVQNSAATVQEDIGALSSDAGNLSQDITSMKGDLATAANDLASTQGAASAVKSEAKQYPAGNSGQVCDDAYQVNDDAYQVNDDAYQIGDDATNAENNISTVQQDESILQSDYQQYVQDLSAVPGYSDTSAASKSGVNSALSSATKSIKSTISTANQYVGAANGDVTAAYAAGNGANQDGNCGSAENAPTPVTTIP